MFWVGLAMTIVSGLIRISFVRDWIQHIVLLDIISAIFLIIGAVITVLSYMKSQREKQAMKESLQIVEDDLYRIKKFDVDVSIVDINGTEFHSHPSPSEEMGLLSLKNGHELDFDTNKHHIFRIEYIYELVDELDKKIDIYGKPIDILPKYYLRLHPKIIINNGGEAIESKSRMLDFLKGIYFTIKVNDIAPYKFFIDKDKFEIESIRDDPNYQEKIFTKQIYLGEHENISIVLKNYAGYTEKNSALMGHE
jgi:hypothetical protein